MAFNPKEVAEITVHGMKYRDWESVTVFDEEYHASDYFRFTCSEGKPLSKNWTAIRIRPGDHCTVMLAGQLAISGFVETRQVAYTGESHGIEIIGHNYTRALNYGAVMHDTHEIKNASYTQIANTICKPFGIQFKPIGAVSEKKFERVCMAPGETAWNVLDTLARQRGIVLGSNAQGNLTGRVQWDQTGDALIEGINILEGREIMTLKGGSTGYNYGQSQQPSTDERHGPKAAQAPFSMLPGSMLASFGGPQGVYAPKKVLLEHPGDKDDAEMRNKFEDQVSGYEQLNVDIVVQGWLRPSGGLWQAGQMVHVTSPMLIVDEDLKLNKVTFTQDNKSGTRTTLSLSRGPGGQQYDYRSQNGGGGNGGGGGGG
jgi:prophage tail gpP-like protein